MVSFFIKNFTFIPTKLKSFIVILFFAILIIIGIDSKLIPKEQWGLKNNGQNIKKSKGVKDVDINIIQAWNYTKGDKNIIVGILDTGIDINHINLQNSIYTNIN